MSNIANNPDVTRKKGKSIMAKIGTVLLIIVVIFMGLTAYIMRNTGMKRYEDFEEFQAESIPYFELPERAEDLQMVIDNKLFSKTYIYSYVLNDKDLDELIESTIQEKYTKTNSDGSTKIEFDEYYDVQVKDIDGINAKYTLDDFLYKLAFDEVIDDSVEDYTVLYYHPVNSGTTGIGRLYNKETNRVLEYYYGQIR